MQFAANLQEAEVQIWFAAKHFGKIFRSVFNSEIDLRLFINYFSLSFFSNSFVIACLFDVENVL